MLDIEVSHSITSLLIGHFLLELGTLKMQREEREAGVPDSDPIGGTLTPGILASHAMSSVVYEQNLISPIDSDRGTLRRGNASLENSMSA